MSTYCSAGAAGPCPLQPRTLTSPTEAHQPARVYRRKSQGLATWTRSRLHQLWALCGPPSRRCVDNSKGCPEGDKREERHGHLLTSFTNLGSTLTPTPPPKACPGCSAAHTCRKQLIRLLVEHGAYAMPRDTPGTPFCSFGLDIRHLAPVSANPMDLAD